MRASSVLSFVALAVAVCAAPVTGNVKAAVLAREAGQPAMDIVGCYGCPEEEKREAEAEPAPVEVIRDSEPAMDIVGCYGCPEEEKREAEAEPAPVEVIRDSEPAMDIVGCYGCPEEE